ncbi:MAG TPA: ribose-5-phosphate isomerase RpiA [Anaerolineales bacterium]|nr:ribose-5-phosphate isomerase RpiA [Anaerolineales bacterium]
MNLKQGAAKVALGYVRSGMMIGLGTGSTTRFFIDMLGEEIQKGSLSGIQAVPTSDATAEQARLLGIPLTTLSENSQLDLAVDGADEVDPKLNLIKGLGGALLREKVVEIHAMRFIVVVDESKIVPRLGVRGPLPVEIIPFEAHAHVAWLNTLECQAKLLLEEDGSPVGTDNGNYLAYCWFSDGIPDPYMLARTLADRPGIVEHGLFLGMADTVVVAEVDGIKILERE